MNKEISQKYIKYGCLAVFALLTIFITLQREPFWDEAHSWMIAKSFNFFELLKIERHDGHLFIWHTLQMPFAKNNFYYPYPIYIMNWLFCMGALIIFWNKAPFSNLEKGLITFSFPFVCYFSCVARCYSIGLLFLFIILSLWKKRCEKAILFSSLLITFANTSAMALCATLPLSLIFLFDLIKEKKKFITPLMILISGAILVVYQLFGAGLPLGFENEISLFPDIVADFFLVFEVENIYDFFKIIFSTFVYIILCLTPFVMKNNERALFFLLVTYYSMVFIFTYKYVGTWWHYCFFFIYFICALWIARLENKKINEKLQKYFQAIFIILLVLFCLKTISAPFYKKPTYAFSSVSKEIYEIIKSKGFLEDKYKIYAFDAFSETSVGIVPYLNKDLYNVYGDKKYTKEGFKNYYKDIINTLDVAGIAESLDKNKINIGISDETMHANSFSVKHKNKTVKFDLIHKQFEPDLSIYKISIN